MCRVVIQRHMPRAMTHRCFRNARAPTTPRRQGRAVARAQAPGSFALKGTVKITDAEPLG